MHLAKNTTLRYALTLALLAGAVGGIAWIAQYLPSTKPRPSPVSTEGKRLLTFVRDQGDWGLDKENPFKDFEPGKTGSYDFFFQNTSGEDVEMAFFANKCDCLTVKACVLAADEWKRLTEEQTARKGVPLTYAREPAWVKLPVGKADVNRLRIGAEEKGAVRLDWFVRDAIGQTIPLDPRIYFQPAGDPSRLSWHQLAVPAKIMPPLQIQPSRVLVDPLAPGRTAKSSFVVWSSTRDTLDFTLTPTPPDPLFVFTATPIAPKNVPALQAELKAKGTQAHVRCAFEVTVTVHESKDGRQLDQGFYYRKWAVTLDGIQNRDPPLNGPEIVGRVDGIIRIGGADDQGKILFRPFSAKEGTSREIQLGADANVVLEKVDGHPNQPSCIEVKLTPGEKEISTDRATWLLEVIVPQGKASAGSFDEPNAVVLRIVGPPERFCKDSERRPAGAAAGSVLASAGSLKRFVRIPLEGHIRK